MADERYRILERLAAGGQAEVFRGISEGIAGFRKSVAIKRVLPELGRNPKFVAMFLDEAKLSLFLQHANIVQVFDISKAPDGAYLLVMEFVDGCDLKELITWQQERGVLLDVPMAVYIMAECCKALDYAHTLEHPGTGEPLGIVHRDVSPANVLLSKNGEVKLVDFGLAKANSAAESTDPGVVKGKFGYLSPEAAHGEEADPRTDVFAVGIVLWELLTGKRLFRGNTDWETIQQVRAAQVPSIRAHNPRVDPELEAIVRKALARELPLRYQNAAELGDALTMHLYSQQTPIGGLQLSKLVREVHRQLRGGRPAKLETAAIQAVDGATSLLAEGSADAGPSRTEAPAAPAAVVAPAPRTPSIRPSALADIPEADEGLVDPHDWFRGLDD